MPLKFFFGEMHNNINYKFNKISIIDKFFLYLSKNN